MIYLLIGLMAFIWGFSFIGTKVLLVDLMPIEILAARWTIALITFLLLIAFKVIKVDFKGKPVKYLLLVATIQPCAYALCETYGVMLTTASESSLFTALIPVMVIVEGVLFLHQKVNKTVLFAVILSFAGVVTSVVFAPDFSTGSKFTGYLLLVLTVIVGGAYTHASSTASKYFKPLEITFALAFEGCIFFNMLSLVQGNGLKPFVFCFGSMEAFLAIMFLGVGCSCIAYLICTYSLSKLNPTIASTVQTNAITIIGVFAGILVGGDDWGWYTIVGMAMTMTGIFITTREGNKQLKAAENN